MTEPVIVHLEEFHLNEIFPDSLPPEAVASLVSFPSFAMEYGEKTLAAGGVIQLAPGRVRLWLHTVPVQNSSQFIFSVLHCDLPK